MTVLNLEKKIYDIYFQDVVCRDLTSSAKFISQELENQFEELFEEDILFLANYRIKVLNILYEPVVKEFTFGWETTGVIDYRKFETGSRLTFQSKMTKDHKKEYFSELEDIFSDYKTLIQRNHNVNKHYKQPSFDIEQATDISEKAFMNSFKKTRNSYSFSLNFKGKNLEDADFSKKHLERANFSNANLKGANFLYSNLKNVNFAGADLRNANLSGADLSYAKFDHSKFYQANLEGMIIDDGEGNTYIIGDKK